MRVAAAMRAPPCRRLNHATPVETETKQPTTLAVLQTTTHSSAQHSALVMMKILCLGGRRACHAASCLPRLLLAAAVLAGSGMWGSEAAFSPAAAPEAAPAQPSPEALAPSSSDTTFSSLDVAAAAAGLPPDAYLNAAGLPLLMPTNRSTKGRRWYYEIPRNPVGTLVMLHRCGRNAEDSWPPSRVCPQCIG